MSCFGSKNENGGTFLSFHWQGSELLAKNIARTAKATRYLENILEAEQPFIS